MKSPSFTTDTPAIPPRQLRSFGFLWGGVLTLVAVWPFVVHQETMRTWALILAGLCILVALTQPRWLQPLYRGWMKVGHGLGFVNTRILLSIGYFFVLTPIGVIRRLLGKDSLHRTIEPDQPTYRSPRQVRLADHMKKQF